MNHLKSIAALLVTAATLASACAQEFLEAEDGIVSADASYTATADATASGGNYLELSDDTDPAGEVSYTLNFTEVVEANVWVRVRGGNALASLNYDLGSGVWENAALGTVANRWIWRKLGRATFPASTHTIKLQCPVSENTSPIELDAIYIAEDTRPYPQALLFSGSSEQTQRVEVADADEILDLSATSLTLECWVNLTGGSEPEKWQTLVSKGSDWGLFTFDASRRIAFRTGTGAADLISGGALDAGTWHHVAAVVDTSANQKRIYIDGFLDGTAPLTNAVPHTAAYTLNFGRQDNRSHVTGSSTNGKLLAGALDDVRIWNTARTSEEIAANAGRILRSNESGLLAYWKFDGFSDEAIDSSPSALDGSLESKGSQPLPNRIPGALLADPLPGNLAVQKSSSTGRWLQSPRANPTASDLATFTFSNQATLECWVFVAATPTANRLLMGTDTFALQLSASNRIRFETDGLVDGQSEAVLQSEPLELNQWYRIAAVLGVDPDSPSDLTRRLYIRNLAGDDVLVSKSTALSGTLDTPTAGFGIGGVFDGRLDELRVWRHALDRELIDELSGHQLNGSEPGLVAAWNFDRVSGEAANQATLADPEGRFDAVYLSGHGDANHVPGVVMASALPPQYALNFNGTNQSVRVAHDARLNFQESFTIEVWVKPEALGPTTLVMKGGYGYGLGLDDELHPIFITGPLTANAIAADRALALGEWAHVALVVDSAADRVAFFINGQPAGEKTGAILNNNDGDLYIGREGELSARHFFGQLDEVRLWNTAISDVEIELFALRELPAGAASFPNIAAWWNFNDGHGLGAPDQSNNGLDGVFQNLSRADYRFGPSFDGSGGLPDNLNLGINPAAAGLWVGTVELDRVSELRSVGQPLTRTPKPARFRLILHVGSDGATRLLKDVVIMGKEVDDGNGGTLEPVLVTNPSLMPDLTGIAVRNGKPVGIRYGSAAYDYDGFERFMAGGVGAGISCATVLDLPATHPTNPYRHKFHPQHATGFEIKRQIAITFDGDDGDPLSAAPGYGVDRITGSYQETVTGLHKDPIQVSGSVNLNRVSTIDELNAP